MQIDSSHQVVVGVFADRVQAQKAVHDLVDHNFAVDSIGIIAREIPTATPPGEIAARTTLGIEGATTGAMAGAGAGAVWAMAIAAGLLPAIGPVLAGGVFSSVLVSAASGAAVAGVLGALIGIGIPTEDAEYYEAEFNAGRALVTVRPQGRNDEAALVLLHNGAVLRVEPAAR